MNTKTQTTPEAPIRVYNMEDVAEILGVTRRTVYNYVKSGRLSATKVGGRWQITETALKKDLEPKI